MATNPSHHSKTMERFIKTLKDINLYKKDIEKELAQSKQRSSAIVNTKLTDAYPEIKEKTTKEFLFKIWDQILKRASRKFSRTWGMLLIQLDELLKVIYPNKLTLRGVLVELRRPLKDFVKWDKTIYEQTIIVMGMTVAESKQEAEKYNIKVKAKNLSRGEMVPIYVEDVYALLDKLIKSENGYDLALAVEIATGSRGIEVFKVSEYKAIEGHPEQISVIGVAKDNKNNNLEKVVITRNLVHLNAKQVIDAVAKIRRLINVDGTNVKISQRTNKHLNAKQKEYVIPLIEKNASEDQKKSEPYKNYIKKFNSHHNRYLFANISYLVNGKNKNIPLNVYAQEQLGHLGAGSTNSYLGINVQFRNRLIRNIDPELKLIIESIDNKVNNLQKDVNECCDNAKINPAVDLRNFKNSFSRKEDNESKINKVVGAIKAYTDKKIKVPKQADLGRSLGFGAKIMTLGYRETRAQGLINNFNIR